MIQCCKWHVWMSHLYLAFWPANHPQQQHMDTYTSHNLPQYNNIILHHFFSSQKKRKKRQHSKTQHTHVELQLVLTRVGVCDDSSVPEITVEIVTTRCLVICVHDISRVGPNCVGLKAWPTIFYGPTVYSSATNIVNVGLQRCFTSIWFWDAPFLWRFGWFRWPWRC